MKEYIEPKIKYLKINEDSLLASQSETRTMTVFGDDTETGEGHTGETTDNRFTGLSKKHHSYWDSEDEDW